MYIFQFLGNYRVKIWFVEDIFEGVSRRHDFREIAPSPGYVPNAELIYYELLQIFKSVVVIKTEVQES